MASTVERASARSNTLNTSEVKAGEHGKIDEGRDRQDHGQCRACRLGSAGTTQR